MQNKSEMLKKYLPPSVEDVSTVQIDLDISNLGIADVLRNWNTLYPKKSRERENIRNGRLVVAILCRSVLLEPAKGIILLIGNEDLELSGNSSNYILFTIDQSRMIDNFDVADILDKISIYMVKELKEEIPKIREFYNQYLYDEFEMESEEFEQNL